VEGLALDRDIWDEGVTRSVVRLPSVARMEMEIGIFDFILRFGVLLCL
jgi:hypothetical protein